MASELKIGIIGLGWGYKYHIKRVQEVDNAAVTALADVNPEILRKAAHEYDISETYSDAKTMLKESDVDGVIIAVPNFLHKEFACMAMENGKHVCLEKPIASTTADAREILAVRDRTGMIMMANFNQRFAGYHPCVKEMIDDGAVGNLLYGKTRWVRQRGIPWGASDWFVLQEKSGGGPMIDIGVHRLDLALYLMGFPTVRSVQGNMFYGQGQKMAEAAGRYYTVEDAGIGYIQFANGSSLVVEASWYLNAETNSQDTVLYGDRGSFMINQDATAYFTEMNGAYTECVLKKDSTPRAKHNIDHFCRVMRAEDELICTAEQAIYGLEIIEAMYRSSETGQPVLFDDPK
jgi:predicted dehydrogenase